MIDTCFNCGAILVNGNCPDCGYYFPYVFDCPFIKNVTCQLNKKLCNKSENYTECKLWQQQS